MSKIRDCHYCEYASCNDADSDVDCYVEDDNYFDHLNDVNKTVFLTKEEAEAKLKELRGE